MPSRTGIKIGKVLWFTGLSGSGKTTLAQRVCLELKLRGIPVEHLDGDEVRGIFPKTGFDRNSRNDHIKHMGFIASKLEKHGVYVVASFISPYEESRRFVRGICKDFSEIYLNTSLEVCEKRDPKGLYRMAREGKIMNFTGVHDIYEVPLAPALTLDTSKLSIEQSLDQCLKIIL